MMTMKKDCETLLKRVQFSPLFLYVYVAQQISIAWNEDDEMGLLAEVLNWIYLTTILDQNEVNFSFSFSCFERKKKRKKNEIEVFFRDCVCELKWYFYKIKFDNYFFVRIRFDNW